MRRSMMFLAIATLMAGAACSGRGLDARTSGQEEAAAPITSAGAEAAIAEETRGEEASQSPSDGEAVLSQEPQLFPLDLRVIREARIELRVGEGSFQQQWDRLRAITAAASGYLSDAQVGTEDRGQDRFTYGTVTVRVPVEGFDDVLGEISELGERISLDISSQDVTEEYVDLEARLRHWRAVEAFHLELLDRAQTIEEALKVQAQLQQIQLSIEQIEGRMRYLDSKTDFATISVFMTEIPGPLPLERDAPRGEIAEALEQARAVLLGTFGFLIVAAAAVFPLALLGLVSYVLWRLGRRVLPRGAGEA